MKIIKNGIVISFVCASCNCKFVVGIHEVVTDGNGKNYHTYCPICGTECHADVNAREQKGNIPE